MSQILQRLIADRQQARIWHDQKSVAFLSVLIGDIQQKHNDKNPATDQDVIARIKVQMKNAKEFHDALKSKESPTTSEAIRMKDLQNEYLILSTFLPAQLDEGDIKEIILANGLDNFPIGKVQQYFKTNHAGQYDGKIVSQVLKSLE